MKNKVVVVTIGSVDNNPYEYVATIKSIKKYTDKIKKEYVDVRGYKLKERDKGRSISLYPPNNTANPMHYDFYTANEWKNRFNEK